MAANDLRIHATAAAGFQAAADSYERGRPDYPEEAVAHLVGVLNIRPGRRVVELGAGTGKLTRLLLSTAAEIVAVEPVAAMRQKLSDLYPPVAVIDGTAESIPVPHATADAVIAAQAFHWFHGPRALGAIHRVLKPNGMLGLIWNVRDESTAWVAKLSEIIDPHEQGVPRYKSMDWKRAFEASARFSPLQTIRFPHIQVATPDSIVDRVASISFIAALPPSTRAAVLGQVRELLRANPAMRGREQIDFPYHTDVYWCRALEA